MIFFAEHLFAQTVDKNLHVTYIANEGFMLQTKNKKVLIDALFTNGYGAFPTPSQSTLQKIINADPPFDQVAAYLLTHYHGDHADSKLIRAYLTRHPEIKLITSLPSLVFIDGEEFGFVKLEKQFVEMTPKQNMSISQTINGIDVEAMGIKHLSFFQDGVDVEKYMFNLGYYLKLDGIGILHTGDASMETFKNYMEKNAHLKSPVDVAFVYFDMLKNGKADIDYLKKTINPKHIVIMHVWKGAYEEWSQKIEELKKYFPNLWFPKVEMETKTYNIDR